MISLSSVKIFFLCLLPILPREVTMDIPVSVKQHDQKGGKDHGYTNPMLFDCFKLPEYALYVKEPQRVFQAQACFVVAVNEFLKFS